MNATSLTVLERGHTGQFLVRQEEKIQKWIKEDLKYTDNSQMSRNRLEEELYRHI